jgi:hypothetical protein
MARYLLVRGVEGRLVANPHVDQSTRRFLGKKPNGVFWQAGPIDPETGSPRWPAAVVAEEVIADHGDVRKAARSKVNGPDIVIVRECIAPTLSEATLAMAAAEPLKKAPRAEVK